MHLLTKANLDNVTEVTRRSLVEIVRSFKFCQIFAACSRRFMLALFNDAHFNSLSISVICVSDTKSNDPDLFFIPLNSFIHTKYQLTLI